MKKLVLATFIFCLAFFSPQLASKPALAQEPQGQEEIYQCLGRGLSKYMNAIIAGGPYKNIRLLSPAFNMTSPHLNGIVNAMANPVDESGAPLPPANFGSLYGVAGNAYNFGGKTISAWVSGAMSNPSLSGKRLLLTETGKIDWGLIELRAELLKIKSGSYGGGQYIGGLLFNAFNTNSSWSNFSLTDSEIQNACAGSCGIVGVNSASYYSQQAPFYSKAQNLGMKLTLEIARNDVNSVLPGIQEAHSRGMLPVIRVGVGSDSGGFADPAQYVAFLKAIDSLVSAPVYAIAGPNEPESEPWATPECGTLEGLSPRCLEPGQDFHSLRPAPHAPCDLNISETTLMCGNQLIAKERLKVDPSDANLGCRSNATGTQTCSYQVQSQVEIHVNLDEADLPIMGNTELVPNRLSQQNSLSPTQRVNEYVSWYLNGAIKRAEEFELNAKELLTFAGPLRKLLPFNTQAQSRIKQINDAPTSSADTGAVRYNQIAGCTRPGALGGDTQGPCYPEGVFAPIQNRLTAWLLPGSPFLIPGPLGLPVSMLPPLEEEPQTIPEYVQKYLLWSGHTCGLLGCFPGPVGWWAKLFSFIPFSSTEDRKGLVTTRNPGETSAGTPGVDVVKITDIIYERDPQGINEILYFAHMQETAELANLLQSTYAPVGRSKTANTKNDSISPEIRPGCIILETRSNPGDDLWAEHNEVIDGVAEEPISSKITYTATFDCTFGAGTLDQACVENNFEQGVCKSLEECQQQCTRSPICEKDISVAVPIDTQTPKIEEIWSRLVEGDLAVFKRIFPKFGPGTPIEKPKDLPTLTQGSYSTTKLAGPESTVTTLAGEQGSARPGESAEIYFPHIGALKEYFLNGIQDALRPKGFGQTPLSGSSAAAAEVKPGKCTAAPPPYCSVENLAKYFPSKEAAENASQICNKESGGNPNAKNLNCTTGRGPDYSIGLFQINLLAHCPGAFSSYSTRSPYSCTIANQQRLQECVTEFSDPENNIQKAVELSNQGTNWRPWLNAAKACSIIQ